MRKLGIGRHPTCCCYWTPSGQVPNFANLDSAGLRDLCAFVFRFLCLQNRHKIGNHHLPAGMCFGFPVAFRRDRAIAGANTEGETPKNSASFAMFSCADGSADGQYGDDHRAGNSRRGSHLCLADPLGLEEMREHSVRRVAGSGIFDRFVLFHQRNENIQQLALRARQRRAPHQFFYRP